MHRFIKTLLFLVICGVACAPDTTMVSDVVFDATTDDVYLVENDIIEEVVEEPSPICPPTGPFGTDPGDVAADVALPDCDGNIRSVHDMCGANAAHINLLAGW